MKSPIPQDLREKTISNIIVVCVGILMAATLMHVGQLWGVVRRVSRTAMPLFIGFAIAFILLPVVKRLERFFLTKVFRHRPHPKLSRVLAVIIAYILLLALVSGFFAILVPQIISSLKSVVTIITNAVPRSARSYGTCWKRPPCCSAWVWIRSRCWKRGTA